MNPVKRMRFSERMIKKGSLADYIAEDDLVRCEAKIDEEFTGVDPQIMGLLQDVLYVGGPDHPFTPNLLKRIMIVNGVSREECYKKGEGFRTIDVQPVVVDAIQFFLQRNHFDEFKALCWILPYVDARRSALNWDELLRDLYSREKLPFLRELLIQHKGCLRGEQRSFLLHRGSLEAILVYMEIFLSSRQSHFGSRNAFSRIRLNDNIEMLPEWPAELVRLFVKCMYTDFENFEEHCIRMCSFAASVDNLNVFVAVFDEFIAHGDGVNCGGAMRMLGGEMAEIARYARVYSLDRVAELIFMNIPLEPANNYSWTRSELASYTHFSHCLKYPVPELATSKNIARLYMWHPRLQDFAEYAYTATNALKSLKINDLDALFKICVYGWITYPGAASDSHAFYVVRKSTPEKHAEEMRDFCDSMYTIVYLISELFDQMNSANIYKKLMSPGLEYPPLMKIATISIMHPMKRGDDLFVTIPFIDYDMNNDPMNYSGGLIQKNPGYFGQ